MLGRGDQDWLPRPFACATPTYRMRHSSYLTSVARVNNTPPVALADLKAHLAIVGTNDDARLTALEWDAVDWIERQTNRYLVPTNVTEVWTLFPGVYVNGNWYGYGVMPFFPYPVVQTPTGLPWHWGEMQRMELSRSPVASITSLAYFDMNNMLQTLVQGTDYWFVAPTQRPAFVQPSSVWPIPYYRPDAVQITYQAGYSTLPPAADAAIKLLVGGWNENREAFNVQSTSELPIGLQALIQSISTGGF